jgi:hypothetical protein
MSIIDVSDICQFVNENSFDKVCDFLEANDMCVKQNEDLYLLANNNNQYKCKQESQQKSQKEEGEGEQKSQKEEGEGEQKSQKEEEEGEGEQKSQKEEGEQEDLQITNEKLQKFKNQCNGVIFERSTNEIVCICQPKITELECHTDAINLVKQNYNSNIRLEYCEDGTIIRLYNYNNTWYTATTKCIDANNSFWSSKKNFDTMFWEIFDSTLLPTLDKNFTYFFVLLHKENRIVVKHNVNMLVYISRIDNKSSKEDYGNVFLNVYGIKRIKYINVNEFLNTSEDYYNKFKRGIIIKIQDVTTGYWDVYKYDFKMYTLIKSIRGNIPEIRMRYLELLKKPETLDLLEKFYSEHYFMFTFIKASLLKLVKTVYQMYVESHIKHTIEVKEDNLYYRTLRQLHAQYKTTKRSISFVDVQTKIYSLDKKIIKNFLEWQ